MTDKDAKPRGTEKLAEAKDILERYDEPTIDIGNVYFAACAYEEACQELQRENERLKKEVIGDALVKLKDSLAKDNANLKQMLKECVSAMALSKAFVVKVVPVLGSYADFDRANFGLNVAAKLKEALTKAKEVLG